MAKRENTKQFYELVRQEYEALSRKSHKGVPMYSQDYVMVLLGEKFLRSPKTIENIVFYRVY